MLSNIRAEMKRSGETNASMARMLEVSENTFSFKLNEKRDFSLSELAKLAKHFNCSIDYLVENSEAVTSATPPAPKAG